MNLIVAVDSNWAIGKENKLLVSIPQDMKFFRETTKGKVVAMGRKTLESFPGGQPLKNRVNVVLTTDKNYKVKDTSYNIELIENVDIESLKDESIDIEYNFLLQYNTDKVWKYLKKKSMTISRIFYLHYTLDLTINEIAEELNISESNVKNYLYRILKELRKYLMEDE